MQSFMICDTFSVRFKFDDLMVTWLCLNQSWVFSVVWGFALFCCRQYGRLYVTISECNTVRPPPKFHKISQQIRVCFHSHKQMESTKSHSRYMYVSIHINKWSQTQLTYCIPHCHSRWALQHHFQKMSQSKLTHIFLVQL